MRSHLNISFNFQGGPLECNGLLLGVVSSGLGCGLKGEKKRFAYLTVALILLFTQVIPEFTVAFPKLFSGFEMFVTFHEIKTENLKSQIIHNFYSVCAIINSLSFARKFMTKF